MKSIVCERTIAWQPKELVDVGSGCQCGITTDDGCYMVLIQSWNGLWKPTSWIPLQVAKRLGELANHYNKDSTEL